MYVLGIDQSYTSLGVVIFDFNGVVIDFKRFSTSKVDDIFFRAWKIKNFISEVIQKYSISHVAIEGLAFGISGNATRDLAGLQFILVSHVRHELNLPIEIYSPLTVKKFATGDGKSKGKTIMIDSLPPEVKDRMLAAGFKKTTGLSDLADAYFIGKIMVQHVLSETENGVVPVTTLEQGISLVVPNLVA